MSGANGARPPLRILLVTPYFPPQNAVASLRTHPFAMHWSRAGCAVTVLTTMKRADQHGLDLPCDGFDVQEIDYRVPRMLERLRMKSRSEPRRSSGPIDSMNGGPMPQQRGVGRPRRLLRRLKERTGVFSSVRMPDLTDWWVKPAVQWARAKAENAGTWDVAVSSSGPYTAHLAAMAIRRAGAAKSWCADFRDLWTANHLYRGMFPFTVRERMLERRCLRAAAVITTVSEGLAAALQRFSRAKVEVIYNGFDPEAMANIPAEPMFPRDDCVRLVYAGTIYPQGQDPMPLLRAMAALRLTRDDAARRLRLIVAGQGGDVWLDAARLCGVSDMVKSRGVLDRADALRLQRDADALILLDWNDPSQGVLTAKVLEHLPMSAPILVTGGAAGSALGQLVSRARRGIHLQRNETRVAQALLDLLDRRSIAQAAPDREFIATLTRERQSLRMLELLRTITQG